MKQVALLLLAMVLALPSAAAGNPNPDIVAVAPNLTIPGWVASISDRLDRKLSYPYYFGMPVPSGGVSVTFRCSDDGSPGSIRVVRRSGHASLDRAAVAAIQRLKTLHPLPAGVRRDQLFQANIVFAVDEATLARETAALRLATRRSAKAFALHEERPFLLTVGRMK